MVWINEQQTVFITTVQALSTIVRNSCPLQSKHLPFSVVRSSCKATPETDLDLESAFINNADISSVFLLPSTLNVNFCYRCDLSHNTDSIDGSHLFEFIDLINGCKTETNSANVVIISDLLDL